MIVVDTNVIASLYLPTDVSAAAGRLLLHQPAWSAPRLWRSELRNALAQYLRRRLVSTDEAMQIQERAESLLAGGELDVASPDVLQLVAASDCSAYDCEFVALARRLGTGLVTADRKILRAFPAVARDPDAALA